VCLVERTQESILMTVQMAMVFNPFRLLAFGERKAYGESVSLQNSTHAT
jgi:hypothetical protein